MSSSKYEPRAKAKPKCKLHKRESVTLNHLNLEDIDSDIKEAVADCIIAWAQVETSLCFIFTRIVSDEVLVGGKLWDSIVNFRDKLSAIDNMMMIVADDNYMKPHLADWRKISEKISKKSKKRNEIAHAAVTEIDGKMVLIPYLSIIEISHHDLVFYTANEIRERAESFINLKNEIDRFYVTYFFDKELLPKPLALDRGPLMEIRVRVAQNPEETAPPDQASEE